MSSARPSMAWHFSYKPRLSAPPAFQIASRHRRPYNRASIQTMAAAARWGSPPEGREAFMEYRVLGKDLKVSALGLGCMGMTHALGAPADEKEMARLLERAVELGCTFFDTAECYTGARPDGSTAYNEALVGRALKPFRDQIVLATKCGVRHRGERLETDSRPETIRRAVEGSLKKLQTDHIDLYYQHRIDPKVEPEVVADTMAALIREGKITHWGISETNEDYLRRAHAVCPVTAVQNRMSMMYRRYEGLFPVLEELGVGFVAFSPLLPDRPLPGHLPV